MKPICVLECTLRTVLQLICKCILFSSRIHDVSVSDTRIPLRCRLNPNEHFKNCLEHVTKVSKNSLRYSRIPLPDIKQPLATYLDVLFNFNTNHIDEQNKDELDRHSVQTTFSLCLTINHDEKMNTLRYRFDASADLFDQSTVQQFSRRFHLLCQQLFCSSFDLHRQPIYELSIILPDEQALLQQLHLSTTDDENETTKTIPQLFIEQAMAYPQKTALTLDDLSFTYAELFTRIQQVCSLLRTHYAIKVGDLVCQCMDRSVEMVIGILAIMMSGGVCVPLNPYDSPDRLQSLIQQIRPKLILTRSQFASAFQHTIDNGPSASVDGLSHIIFTSGSTGVPKGVAIRHHNFVSYMKTHRFDKRDVVLQLASCTFDVHLDEILSALCRGAHLVLLRPGGHLDLDYLTRVIHDHQVTFVAPVPSWIDILCQYLQKNAYANGRVKSVRWWFIGGEQLFRSTIEHLLPFVADDCHLLNTYGPAEITETATSYEICREKLSDMISIPIGQPLAGYRLYLVDDYQQPVMPNQQGEIVIGGKMFREMNGVVHLCSERCGCVCWVS